MDKMAYLVKTAVTSSPRITKKSRIYLSQFGLYKNLTFSKILKYLLESLDELVLLISGNVLNSFSASSEW